jgi:molybdenum cofactor biosynthesis protein MoaC
MKDITVKPETLRTARASATLAVPRECMMFVRERKTEKGDALEIARAAAIMAAKRTSDILPLCHPLPLQNIDVDYDLAAAAVKVEVTVQVIAATGVEMEALTGASVAALALYDMLKPHAGTELAIREVRLIEKRGGKSQFKRKTERSLSASVIVLSDTVAAGNKRDTAGQTARERLADAGFAVEGFDILPDEPEQLRARLEHWLERKTDFIVTIGGTGIGPRDHTVETVAPFLQRELPGVMETLRAYGQQRMPYAMLSRGIAGVNGKSLILTLPGSTGGVREGLDAVLVGLLHAFATLRGDPHQHGYGAG